VASPYQPLQTPYAPIIPATTGKNNTSSVSSERQSSGSCVYSVGTQSSPDITKRNPCAPSSSFQSADVEISGWRSNGNEGSNGRLKYLSYPFLLAVPVCSVETSAPACRSTSLPGTNPHWKKSEHMDRSPPLRCKHRMLRAAASWHGSRNALRSLLSPDVEG
jgi:hypothetical protein